MDSIGTINLLLNGKRDSATAFQLYKPIILALAAGNSILEIGAGRRPLFSYDEIRQYNIDYTANDISVSELEAMEESVNKCAFDASKFVPASLQCRFDLVFSRMVQEHIRGTKQYYLNLGTLLKPGGTALNFHPVLYSLPFILNRIMPERLSSKVVYQLRRDRSKQFTPKFPAIYDHCRVNTQVREELRSQGFSSLHQIPFYGHGYYTRIPPLNALQGAVSAAAERFAFTTFATFCYTVAIK